MKTKINSIGLAVAMFFVLSACEKVMDIHKDFIKDGEIVYATKPDSLYFVAGKERVELNYRMFNGNLVNSVNIYWNDYKDSLRVNVSLPQGVSTGKIIIDGLPEKSYTFYVQTANQFGNKSLLTSGFGVAYGSIYQASLTDRKVKDLELDANGGRITWYPPIAGLVRNEVRYVDKYGKERQVQLKSVEHTLSCPDVLSRGTFEYRSVYIPEKASIDTFYTDWVQAVDRFPYQFVDVDRSQWNILYYNNSDPQEGSPKNMLDNNSQTYWHSDYHNPSNYPYVFVVDMKEPIMIGQIGAQSRLNNHYSKGMEFYIAEEYTGPSQASWFKIGSLDLPQHNDFTWKTCTEEVLNKQRKTRYLKVVLTNGYNGHLGAIAELSVRKVA